MAGNDYDSQLRSTLESARAAVLLMRQKSKGLRQQTAATLGHAEQTLAVGDANLANAMDALEGANTLFRLASQGSVIVHNATDLAAAAVQDVADATQAMSTAANSIKALTDAFDMLAFQVSGIEALTEGNDRGTQVAAAASKAMNSSRTAATSTDELKNASINASIEAARAAAGPAALAVRTVATELESLAGSASAQVAAATAKVDLRRKADVLALQAEKAALRQYHSARGDDESLTAVVEAINTLVTDHLKATAHTEPDDDGKVKPKLTVTFTHPKDGTRYVCFAVPIEESSGFSVETAKKHIREDSSSKDIPLHYGVYPAEKRASSEEKDASFSELQSDLFGHPLEVGSTYTVFTVRRPEQGLSVASAADLSLPSEPVTLTYNILPEPSDKPGGQKPLPILSPQEKGSRNNEFGYPFFKVSLTLPKEMEKTVGECRFILMREDVFHAVRHDALLLANLLNRAFYKEKTQRQKTRRVKGKGVQHRRAHGRERQDPGANDSTATYTETFWESDTDAFGDIFAPGNHYRALVLLVGIQPDKTPNVLLGAETEPDPEAPPGTASHVATCPSPSDAPDDAPPPQADHAS